MEPVPGKVAPLCQLKPPVGDVNPPTVYRKQNTVRQTDKHCSGFFGSFLFLFLLEPDETVTMALHITLNSPLH